MFYWQEDLSKFQQRRTPGKWLHFLSSKKKQIKETLDTVDLEELPGSRERTRATVQRLSCEGQADVREMFSDNSYLSAILDGQGLLVAAPIDLRTKKA